MEAVYERHGLWSPDETWERLLQQVQADADAAGEIDWDISATRWAFEEAAMGRVTVPKPLRRTDTRRSVRRPTSDPRSAPRSARTSPGPIRLQHLPQRGLG